MGTSAVAARVCPGHRLAHDVRSERAFWARGHALPCPPVPPFPSLVMKGFPVQVRRRAWVGWGLRGSHRGIPGHLDGAAASACPSGELGLELHGHWTVPRAGRAQLEPVRDPPHRGANRHARERALERPRSVGEKLPCTSDATDADRDRPLEPARPSPAALRATAPPYAGPVRPRGTALHRGSPSPLPRGEARLQAGDAFPESRAAEPSRPEPPSLRRSNHEPARDQAATDVAAPAGAPAAWAAPPNIRPRRWRGGYSGERWPSWPLIT
jgi:hypothetical protein